MASWSLGRQRWYSMPALIRARAYFSCSAESLPSAFLSSQKMTPRDGTDVETRTRSGNPLPSDRQTPGRGDEGDAWKTSHCCILATLITWSWNIFSLIVIVNNHSADEFCYLWHYSVSKSSNSVHPKGNPIIHSRNTGFGRPPTTSAMLIPNFRPPGLSR